MTYMAEKPTIIIIAKERSMDERQRFTVTLTKNAAEILEDLARRTGKSKSDIMRDALFLERYVRDAWDEKGRVIVERNGDKYEILPH